MIQQLVDNSSKNQIPEIGTIPEIQLLLCCARTYINTTTADRIENLLQEELDWDYIIKAAYRHGLIPLLYNSLNNTCPEAVPQAILSQLQNLFNANALRNAFLAEKLLKALNLFQTHDIPAVSYKGPILAASVYGNLALRTFGDLDILIKKRDFYKTKDLLLSEGYRSWWTRLSEARQAAVLRCWCEFGFVERLSKHNKVYLDLHWAFASNYFSFPLDTEDLWERLEKFCLTGTEVANFAPEDLLLILCMHGTKDNWERLIWICDVAELLRANPEMNWEKIIERADKLGARRILFLGLWLAREVLGATVPEKIALKIEADSAVNSLGAQISKILFGGADSLGKNPFFYPLLRLRVRERWQDKVRDSLALIGPQPDDYSSVSLPESLAFLYYPLRFIRLAGKTGGRFFKLLRRV